MTDDRPHYLGHRQRLRERFIKSGLSGFADYEVVELLLTLAIPRLDAKEQAKAPSPGSAVSVGSWMRRWKSCGR